MKFAAIVDVAAFIWDKVQFEQDQSQFYPIMESIPPMLNLLIAKKIPVVFRYELFEEVTANFPFGYIPPQYHDFTNTTLRQLTKLNMVGYENNATYNLSCNPSLIREHFAESVQEELKHLINSIYKDTTIQKLLTFKVFWQENVNMLIQNGSSKEIETKICDDLNTHEDITDGLKKMFEHNPKHKTVDSVFHGKHSSRLRCYNAGTKDKTKIQQILDNSVYVEGVFYGYDYENKTYIKFFRTQKNLYHGFEVAPPDELKEKIEKALKDG